MPSRREWINYGNEKSSKAKHFNFFYSEKKNKESDFFGKGRVAPL